MRPKRIGISKKRARTRASTSDSLLFVNARPALERIAAALAACKLEAILIGNAAAALHGAPVTTLDFDFLFRETPLNLKKLKALAKELGGTVFRPYYPVSRLYRFETASGDLQLDFMPAVHGIRKFESARSRSVALAVGGATITVASLDDIIASKRAAARARDLAVLPILEATRDEKAKLEQASGEAPKRPRPRRR
jgi:hypothetical protein